MENQNIISNLKIVKRHNPGATFIGILCLLSIGVPVILWILPWFQIMVGSSSGQTYYDTGVYLLNPLNLIKNLITLPDEATLFIIKNGWTSAQIRGNDLNYYFVKEILGASAVWYILSAIFALILFILGLVLLFKGRLKHNHGVVVVAALYFLSNGFLLLDAFRLGWYLGDTMKKSFTILGVEAVDYYQYAIWPNYIVGGVALGLFLLILITYCASLRKRYYMEDIEFVEVPQPQPYEKNDGIIRNTLPEGLTVIGGHAFYKNTNLEIANIQNGVKELGIGAFSNCVRLKVVTIPRSVRRIHSNCFFNCAQLKRINYGGTKQQWRYISRGTNWLAKAGTTTVLCSDGAITVNPLH